MCESACYLVPIPKRVQASRPTRCGSKIWTRLVVSLNDSGDNSIRDELDVLMNCQSLECGRRLPCYARSLVRVVA